MTKEQVAVRKAKAEAFREAAAVIDLDWAKLGTRSRQSGMSLRN